VIPRVTKGSSTTGGVGLTAANIAAQAEKRDLKPLDPHLRKKTPTGEKNRRKQTVDKEPVPKKSVKPRETSQCFTHKAGPKRNGSPIARDQEGGRRELRRLRSHSERGGGVMRALISTGRAGWHLSGELLPESEIWFIGIRGTIGETLEWKLEGRAPTRIFLLGIKAEILH